LNQKTKDRLAAQVANIEEDARAALDPGSQHAEARRLEVEIETADEQAVVVTEDLDPPEEGPSDTGTVDAD
tara:strand:- start:1048 stop:1260 length:213 start_codon:yes stop_codon:yes gene_type:complete